MLNTNKIEELIKESGMTNLAFYKKIGITKAGYRGIKESKDMKLSMFVKVCELFQVNMYDLIEGKENHPMEVNEPQGSYGLSNENEALKKEVEHLKQLVDAKDKIIQLMAKLK